MSTVTQPFRLPGHVVVPEPKLRFGSNDPQATDIHPMEGLIRFGPYSLGELSPVPNPIRVGMIVQAELEEALVRQMRELEQAHQPRERKQYLPPFPGFEKLFGVRMARRAAASRILLSQDLDGELEAAAKPHVVLAEALTRALLRCVTRVTASISLSFAQGEMVAGLSGSGRRRFRSPRLCEGLCRIRGHLRAIPARVQRAELYCRCSVAWRLGIALYTKAGGTPLLADVEPGTAFIGIDYALRAGGQSTQRFAICCSQVFDAEGSGLEFVAYEADGVQMFGKNPYLRRDQMLKVMARSLSIYQRKHAGDPPRRIVVHKNTEFRSEEIEGVFDVLPNADSIELVHVQQSCGWRGVLIAGPQRPHGYPCQRGTTYSLVRRRLCFGRRVTFLPWPRARTTTRKARARRSRCFWFVTPV
ncbi:hypothetical protein [Bradyrhizobium glycinis]|uniref:hypothetical protein n=1 Tax=Bradyrhizobium glycinis TaxID=2751812 RepID=UPI0018D86556|nr:hypothetical protein [Bradyrhizobium glycinis]